MKQLKYRLPAQYGPCICGCGVQTVRIDTQGRPRRFVRGHQGLVHGASKTNIYAVWSQMVQRCTDPNNQRWSHYGGRGIEVCDRWRSFELFIADMGPRPSGMTIDRINNEGNYEPSNCRWASMRQQSNNRRNNRLVTIGSETRTVAEWSRLKGISGMAIYARLRLGWSERRAVEQPVRRHKGRVAI